MASNLPALPTTIRDILNEYAEKSEALPRAIEAFKQAVSDVSSAACIHGVYAHHDMFGRGGTPRVDVEATKKAMLVSGWNAIYRQLSIDRVSSASDRDLYKQSLADPPPLTEDNVIATFEKYIINPRFHILRGLAECFCKLDPAYKSHSKVKIGASALPKRIILEYMRGWGTSGYEKLKDVLNAIACFQGKPLIEAAELRDVDRLASTIYDNKAGTVYVRGQEVRIFKNGNAHLIFEPDTLRAVNKALAEFYGDVLPDVEPTGTVFRTGTNVSKDLQYYPTPLAVIHEALGRIDMPSKDELDRQRRIGNDTQTLKVLEPSCGDGRIMDEVRARGHHAYGVEVHPGRATEARLKGHAVLTANFLECTPRPEFDAVVMNPPFYGRHYSKHVRHAIKFLKPGGKLVAILPATACYDHEDLADLMKPMQAWSDLPVASFAESGTNVPTGLLVHYKRD